MLAIYLLIFILVQLLVLFYQTRKRRVRFFEKLAIPGPKPHWLLGNLLELQNTTMSKRLSELSAKFGNMWGFFEGPNPILILSTPELVREFYMNQSRSFQARKLLPIKIEGKSDPGCKGEEPRNIFQSHGPVWHTIRYATEPAFTDHKLSAIEQTIDRHMENLMARFPKDEAIDFYPHLLHFGLHLNCDVFFGIALNEEKERTPTEQANVAGSSHPIQKGMIDFFQDMERLAQAKGLWALAILLPELHFLLRPFCARLINSRGVEFLTTQVRMIIQERLASDVAQQRQDLLENLINCTNLRTPQKKNAPDGSKLSGRDIAEQVQVFLYAGYETTATAIAYVFYCLARHPEVQEQLRSELQALKGPVTGRSLKNVRLLEGVIREALRLYPVVSSIALSRRCTASEAVTVDGVAVPPGTFVTPDVHSIHRNPLYWGPTDPNVFDPLRPQLFEKTTESWLAFGVGPRRCMGQKYALVTIRRAIYHLLLKYQLECTSDNDLELTEGFNILPKAIPVRITELKL